MSKAAVSVQENDSIKGGVKNRAASSRSSASFLSPVHSPLASTSNSISSIARPLIQPKLKIGTPNDKYEQEADRVADQVMSMPGHAGSGTTGITNNIATPNIQRLCAGCQGELEQNNTVQSKAASGHTVAVTPNVANGIHSLKGSGQPLPESNRNYFEPRFGNDFSQVRIHADQRAAGLAQSINAKAFTFGRDVVFGTGQYAPGTSEGRRLMAHELTHVVQQGGRGKRIQRVRHHVLENNPDDAPAMSCEPARSSPDGISLDVTFSINSSELTPEDVDAVENFVNNWHQSGGTDPVRVDGYASKDGGPELNWPLSCDRAEVLANELMTPRNSATGIDPNYIEIFANGETESFSDTLAPNRRATATIPARSTPPTPKQPSNNCRATQTVTIDFVKLHGSTRNPVSDLAFTNRVFRQCCVQFRLGKSETATRAQTLLWLNGDTTLSRIHSCSNVHAEENSLRTNATTTFSLSSRYKAFYVSALSPALRGVNFSPDCSSGARAPFNRHLYIANTAANRTLAHELGHIPIRGLRDHTTHGDGTRNLMEPTNTATGEHLTASQCREVGTNV